MANTPFEIRVNARHTWSSKMRLDAVWAAWEVTPNSHGSFRSIILRIKHGQMES